MLQLRYVCLLSFSIALACSSDSAEARGPGQAPAPRPADAPAPPAVGALREDMAEPYFRAGKAREAAERFALEDWQGARAAFRAHLEAGGLGREDEARARLLMALAEAELGAWAPAAEGFERALAGLPLLSDYIRYQAARAHYFARKPDAALRHARAVSAASIVGADAELLVGDILRGQKKHQEVAAHYANYLADRPGGIRRAEARFRLAEAQEALGKAVPDAADNYRALTIAAPLSSWAKSARERLDALQPRMDEATRRRYQTLSAAELIERGMVYYDAMRNPESEADFAAALSAPGLTPALRCTAAYHRANSVFKARDRTRAAPLFDEAGTICKDAGNIDLQVKAAYQAGRSYAHIGQRQTAIERYRQAEGVSPSHTFVDDARLRQAEEYAELGNDAEVRALLASIPERYPQGDMRAEALWRLAWRAYRAGEYAEAIRWLEKQVEVMPIDDNYWAEGQAQYWMGRAWARLGKADKAQAAYREAVLRYPLSYYALLALNRLREKHPAAFRDVSREIATPPAGTRPGESAFRFQPRPEYASPGFGRALELMRLGLGGPAEAELRRLGMNMPPGKEPLTDPDRIEKTWATAYLYDRAGRYSQSHWPTRWHLADYKRAWPAGPNRDRWLIAYPRAYWGLLDEHATKHGFPTELLIAIVREESAFDPLRESFANAVGLTQMIMPTARRFSPADIEASRETLRDPEKNVTIGARFLAFLWTKWNKHIMLVPPSYNAGEGAVTRMLRERGHLAADEWIEAIKTDQARNYSKRVLASYFAYTYLYRGEIPVISNNIPASLVPGKSQGAK